MIETPENTTKKRRVITVKVSPSELALIKQAAQMERLTMSEYVRRAIIRRMEKEIIYGHWDGKQWVANQNVS